MTKRKPGALVDLETVDLDALTPHPRNYLTHPDDEIDHLVANITEAGFYRNIVIASDNVILAGHGVVQACRKMGLQQIHARRLPFPHDDPRALKVLAADNEIGRLALRDEVALTGIMNEIVSVDLDGWTGLLGTGWTQDQLTGPSKTPPPDAEPQPDRAEELRKKWGVEAGQIWKLGDHRLLCGDCTKTEDVERVMGGDRAALCFTSPPYNVAAKSSLPNKQKYADADDSTSPEEYLDLLLSFTSSAMRCCDYVFVNVQSISGNKTAIVDYLHELKPSYADVMIWDKMTGEPAMAENVLNSRFEFVFVFSGKANRAIGAKRFRGTLDNIVQINSRADKENSDVHRATMPIALAAHFVENFSNDGDGILEPFDGCGTTLIACEQLHRRCRAIEISPGYVAVALQRWADATGRTPVLA